MALAGSRAAIASFRDRDVAGSIVNISSHQAQRPVRGALPYATAKAAIEGLTRALAVDYGRYDIRANALALGSIRTARQDEFMAAQSKEEAARIDAQLKELHPLGRIGTPDEVARVVEFLISDKSGFISGAVIPVDGGRSVNGADPEAR